MVKPKDVETGISFGITTIVITCHMCKKDFVVELSNDEYDKYFIRGMNIRTAMPNKSDDIHELCISGTCGECFDKLFPPEEDDDIPEDEQPTNYNIEDRD